MTTKQQILDFLSRCTTPVPYYPFSHSVVLDANYIDWDNEYDGMNPLNLSEYAPTAEVHDWLAENVEPSQFKSSGETFRFEDENDAFAFKMRFG